VTKAYKIPSAFKHGAYSTLGVLPGEDCAAFNRLHKTLITEYDPSGPLEEDIVARIARLLWRKQNLETFEIAKWARGRDQQIMAKIPHDEVEYVGLHLLDDGRTVIKAVDPAVREAARRAAIAESRKELGCAYEFIENSELATTESLTEAMELNERLSAQIEKEMKRLAFVKGFKSVISSQPAAPPRIARLHDAA
jgi:hypothetical protein